MVNYSIPVNKKVTLEELKKHLYTLPELPNAIPYVTSYYKRQWGFCIKYNEYLKDNVKWSKLEDINNIVPEVYYYGTCGIWYLTHVTIYIYIYMYI